MIRVATALDAERIVPLFREVQQLHAEQVPALFNHPAAITGEAEWLARIVGGAQAFVLIAEDDERAVGYLIAQDITREATIIRPAQRYFLLEHIAVARAAQQRGIGSALVAALFAEVQARGVARVELDVWTFNERSRRFFARHGFHAIHQRMEFLTGTPGSSLAL